MNNQLNQLKATFSPLAHRGISFVRNNIPKVILGTIGLVYVFLGPIKVANAQAGAAIFTDWVVGKISLGLAHLWVTGANWFNESAWRTFRGLIIAIIGFLKTLGEWLLLFFAEISDYLVNSTLADNSQGILNQEIVERTFDYILTFANTLFLIALAVFAIMIILRQTGYTFKRAITGLVVAVALANLSRLIVLAIVEISDMLARWPLASIEGGSANVFRTLIQAFTATETSQFVDFVDRAAEAGNKGGLIELAVLILIVIVLFIGVYVLFRLAFILVERAVRLVVYLVFAPLVFALYLFPSKELQNLASSWWSEVIKWAMVLPVVVFLMKISFDFLLMVNETMLENGIVYGIRLINQGQPEAAAANVITASFVFFIIAIALLLAAANIQKPMGIAATKFTEGAANLVSGGVKAASRFAWRAGTAPVKAGARRIGQRTAAMAKNLGFRVATTGPLKGWTKGIYKVLRGPQLAEAAQAKERELFFRGAEAEQLRARYVNLNSRVSRAKKPIQERIAQRDYKKSYDALSGDEKSATDQKVDKAISRNVALSKDKRNLEALEGGYMRILGEASKEEYELGKLPAETFKEFEKYARKYEANPKDAEAGFRMQVMFDVLKKQALRLTGPQRNVAIANRNTIAENVEYKNLLKRAGFPEKFGYAPISASEPIEKEVVSRLAADTRAVEDAKDRVESLGAAIDHLPKIRLAASSLSDTALLQSLNPAIGGTLAPDAYSEKVTAKNNVRAMSRLTKAQREEIANIQSQSLPPNVKEQLIRGIIGRGPATRGNAQYVSTVLSHGIRVQDIDKVQDIAEFYHDSSRPDHNTVKNYVDSVTTLRQARVQQAATQAIVPPIDPGPAYRRQVQATITAKKKTPAGFTGSTSEYVSQEVPRVKVNLLKELGGISDDNSRQEAVARPTKDIVTPGTHTKIEEIRSFYKIPKIKGEGVDTTVEEDIEMLNKLEAAGRNLNPPTESELNE